MPIFGCQRYLSNKKVNWMTPVGPSRAELSQVKMHVIHYLILLKFFLLHWYFYAHFWMSKVPRKQKSQLVNPRDTFTHRVIARQNTYSSVSNTVQFFWLFWYFYAYFWMSKVPCEEKSQLVDPCGTFMRVVYRRSKYMFFNDWYCWILNAVLILLMQLLIIIMFSLVIFIDGATK